MKQDPKTVRRLCFLGVMLLFGPHDLSGQRVLTINVSALAVAQRDTSACQYQMSWGPSTVRATVGSTAATPLSTGAVAKASAATKSDQIIVNVFEDDTRKVAKPSPTPLDIHLDRIALGTVPSTRTSDSLDAGAAGLVDRVLTVWQANSTDPLCAIAPFPRRPSFEQRLSLVTHTDVIASGEVGSALRTGADNNSATGTLGFHHISLPEAGERATRFPWLIKTGARPDSRSSRLERFLYWTSFPMDGEDLRAVVSVASTTDSVVGPGRANFAQAVLFPAYGQTGGSKAVNLEYYSYMTFGKHQSIGPVFRLAASQSKWAPDKVPRKEAVPEVAATATTPVIPGSAATPAVVWPSRTAVNTAFDARIRAVLINRLSDSDDNSFSFAVDGGLIRRTIAGDVTALPNKLLLLAATGDSARTSFTGWAVGTYFRLRQVTAFADFQCLSCGFPGIHQGRNTNPTFFESLEGLQPIIGFRFEAPFITIRH